MSSSYEECKKMIPFIIDRARINAKAHNTSIVYVKDGNIVEEFPDGSTKFMRKLETDQ